MADDRVTAIELAESLGLSRRAATAFVVAHYPDLADSEIAPEMRQRIGRHRDEAISRAAIPAGNEKGGR